MNQPRTKNAYGCESVGCFNLQEGQCECGDNLCSECLDDHYMACERDAMDEMGDERDPEDLP